MREQMWNIGEPKTMKKAQMEILEVKKYLKIKNSLGGLNNRLDITEEKFSEIEDGLM